MRKAIAIVSAHSGLKALEDFANGRLKDFRERSKFLDRQRGKILEEINGVKTDLNTKLKYFLERENMLPDEFDDGKFHFHVDDGVLIMCDGAEHPPDFNTFLTKFFGGK